MRAAALLLLAACDLAPCERPPRERVTTGDCAAELDTRGWLQDFDAATCTEYLYRRGDGATGVIRWEGSEGAGVLEGPGFQCEVSVASRPSDQQGSRNSGGSRR